MKFDQITAYTTDLSNWQPMSKVAEVYPQFSQTQLKRIFWLRDQHKGLSTCYKRVGKRGYVCLPLFGLWLSGQLPEQQEANTTDS
ncbi:hypothetical protein NOK75_00855 [Vibrio parahaemolyticus]|uniref:hypothetical protein n=1 Tax=Vibrio parahaemolyticus TaxID=670 RepID=UPI00226B7FCC|nr:hypothetical protein [Vibrio parahaemolyticus]MCX8840456.1 hypothetical protein [Vibrio parahaemolyticus]HCG8859553.1 hypothetical protein [Vibrio parahaemolyticus]